jgi:predicted ester cyclase
LTYRISGVDIPDEEVRVASANFETAVAYLDAGFRCDYDTCARYIHPDYVWVDRALGVVLDIDVATAEELERATADDAAWSDRTLDIERIIEATESTIVIQATVTQTHTGIWQSIPATGRRVVWPFLCVLDFSVDGRIVREDGYHDHLSILRQLGVQTLPT